MELSWLVTKIGNNSDFDLSHDFLYLRNLYFKVDVYFKLPALYFPFFELKIASVHVYLLSVCKS